MTKPIQLTLRAGERIYINGAVVRVDRKVTLELLNEVTFLLESHVLQPEQTTTPLRQLYFALQTMLMEPAKVTENRRVFEGMYVSTYNSFANETVLDGLKSVAVLVGDNRLFEALRTIRMLFPIEQEILAGREVPSRAA
jgi:flagellar protein FlbT